MEFWRIIWERSNTWLYFKRVYNFSQQSSLWKKTYWLHWHLEFSKAEQWTFLISIGVHLIHNDFNHLEIITNWWIWGTINRYVFLKHVSFPKGCWLDCPRFSKIFLFMSTQGTDDIKCSQKRCGLSIEAQTNLAMKVWNCGNLSCHRSGLNRGVTWNGKLHSIQLACKLFMLL